eukprot:6179295-Pleurochrysis_carterae.AAC.4
MREGSGVRAKHRSGTPWDTCRMRLKQAERGGSREGLTKNTAHTGEMERLGKRVKCRDWAKRVKCRGSEGGRARPTPVCVRECVRERPEARREQTRRSATKMRRRTQSPNKDG